MSSYTRIRNFPFPNFSTNSIEWNPFWEVDILLAIQETDSLLFNPNVHYRAHKIQLLVSALIRTIQVYILNNLLFGDPVSSYLHLRLVSPSAIFHPAFPNKCSELITYSTCFKTVYINYWKHYKVMNNWSSEVITTYVKAFQWRLLKCFIMLHVLCWQYNLNPS